MLATYKSYTLFANFPSNFTSFQILRLDIIRLATGCNDLEHIAQMLQDCENDSDATIECLVAELAAGAEWNESNESNESKRHG